MHRLLHRRFDPLVANMRRRSPAAASALYCPLTRDAVGESSLSYVGAAAGDGCAAGMQLLLSLIHI